MTAKLRDARCEKQTGAHGGEVFYGYRAPQSTLDAIRIRGKVAAS